MSITREGRANVSVLQVCLASAGGKSGLGMLRRECVAIMRLTVQSS